MDQQNDIIEGLKMLTGYNRRTRVIAAKVVAVSQSYATCDVQDQDGVVLYDVRLRAATDGETSGHVCLPDVGAWVLIANLDGAQAWAVVATEKLSKYSVEIETSLLEMDEDGVKIQRGADDLKSVLSDLLSALEVLTVTCAAPGSPSTPPVNLASFTTLKTRVNNLLK